MHLEGMKKRLYPHQIAALQKMEEREREKRIRAFHYEIDLQLGLYSDIAGFGKTVTMIALMLRDAMPWCLTEDLVKSSIINVCGNGYVVKRSLTSYHRIRTSLVVATPLVLNQWRDELEETSLSYTMVTSRKSCDRVDPNDVDVLLTTPTYYNHMIDRFPSCAWKRFIYDDPTHCRIPSMRPLVAGHLWMLSATPDMLLYQHRSTNHFMSSIFCTNLDYNIYKHLIIKNPDDFVRESFRLPPREDLFHQCYEPLVWVVRDILSPQILEMVSAGNIEGAVRSLGGTSTSNLYDLVIRERQEALQMAEWKIARWDRQSHPSITPPTPSLHPHDPLPDYEHKLQKWVMRKEKILRELNEIRHRIQRVLNEDRCHICLDPFVKPIMVTCCHNLFCGKCIFQWMNKQQNTTTASCPLCRKMITPDHLVHMTNYSSDSETTISKTPIAARSKPSKMQTLDTILTTHPEGRFIIFSSYDETFSKIREVLVDAEMEYAELSGRRHETRQRIITDFKEARLRVLFMNSFHDGAGVNLHEATDIILYHEMTDMMKTQIIGRAYRIGRTHPLRVHHLVDDHTTMTTSAPAVVV